MSGLRNIGTDRLLDFIAESFPAPNEIPAHKVTLNGKEVDSVARLLARLDDCKPGEAVELTIWRNGKRIRVPVTLRSGEDDN